jgi:anti-sigma factor RsiW
MECRKIKKYLLKSLDNRLNEDERPKLDSHLKQCPACKTKQHEYQEIRDTLMIKDFPAPKPYFWERLKPRLENRRSYGLWPLWKQWGIRTIPLSLAVIFFALIVTALLPPSDRELSQSGSIPLLGEEEVDNPNMILLFTSLEETNETRRY